jgi:hypothetical protein
MLVMVAIGSADSLVQLLFPHLMGVRVEADSSPLPRARQP